MDNMVTVMGLLMVILPPFTQKIVQNGSERKSKYYFKSVLKQAARGLGAGFAPVLVGKLYDLTGSYSIANTAGCVNITSSVICMLWICRLHCKQLAKSPLLD